MAVSSDIRSARLIAFWRVAFCAGTVAVTVLSLLPGDAVPALPDIGDKLQHGFAYAALAVLAGLGWRWGRALQALLVGLALLGGAIEIGQIAIPGRYGEWADFAADVIGIVAGLAAVGLLRRALGRIDRDGAARKHRFTLL